VSAGAYLLGIACLVLVAGAVALAATSARRRLLPGWAAAPARLAELVLGLGFLTLVAELLGTLGVLTRGTLVVGSLAAAGAVAWATRRGEPAAGMDEVAGGEAAPAEPAQPAQPADRPLALAALGAGLLVMAQWGTGAKAALDGGMLLPDTLWYHMPLAAEFAQEGSLTGLHYAEAAPITAFFPANAELYHALGLLLLDRDVLSPFLNLGFVALALLGGWCLARPRGAAPLGLLAAALAVTVPIFWGIQAGQAGNDVVGLGFLLAALGLLATERQSRAALAVAGLAAGLALGTKLSLVAPVLALSVAVIALAPRGRRGSASLVWGLPLLAAGGYWYARNLLRTGSPLPWVSFDLGPIEFEAPPRPLTEGLEFPVAHYATDFGVWADYFIPDLEWGLGWAWPALLLLGAAGVVSAIASGDARRRALGLVGGFAVVAYLLTPNGAAGREGDPWGFGLNLRYAVPALAIALALAATSPWLDTRKKQRIAFAVAAAVLVFNLFSPSGLWPYRRDVALALVVAGAALALGVGLLVRARPGRLGLAAALAASLLVLALGGWFLQRDYLSDRYSSASGVSRTGSWARDLSDTRIGVVGFTPQYPLYGTDVSNTVEHIGRRGPNGAFGRIRSCRGWRRAVNRAGYRYLVISPVRSPNLPPAGRAPQPAEAGWTRADPAAKVLLRDGETSVFELERPLGGACA
jgi:hypothetical protein